MKSFKEFIAEGGNVIIDGIGADRIDLNKIDRKKIVSEIGDRPKDHFRSIQEKNRNASLE